MYSTATLREFLYLYKLFVTHQIDRLDPQRLRLLALLDA